MTCPPRISGTELPSATTRSPCRSKRTTSAFVTGAVPAIFCAKSSRARRRSSGAQTEVNCCPRTSPTISNAAWLTQRITPAESIMYEGTFTASSAASTSASIARSVDMTRVCPAKEARVNCVKGSFRRRGRERRRRNDHRLLQLTAEGVGGLQRAEHRSPGRCARNAGNSQVLDPCADPAEPLAVELPPGVDRQSQEPVALRRGDLVAEVEQGVRQVVVLGARVDVVQLRPPAGQEALLARPDDVAQRLYREEGRGAGQGEASSLKRRKEPQASCLRVDAADAADAGAESRRRFREEGRREGRAIVHYEDRVLVKELGQDDVERLVERLVAAVDDEVGRRVLVAEGPDRGLAEAFVRRCDQRDDQAAISRATQCADVTADRGDTRIDRRPLGNGVHTDRLATNRRARLTRSGQKSRRNWDPHEGVVRTPLKRPHRALIQPS